MNNAFSQKYICSRTYARFSISACVHNQVLPAFEWALRQKEMAWAAYAQSAKTAWQQKLGGDKALHSSDFTPDQASLQDALVQYLLQV